LKRVVSARDGGRCKETGFLEFHHLVPYATGGETSVANMELRCRAHNAYEVDQYFGRGPTLFARERRDVAWTRRELVPVQNELPAVIAESCHTAWRE
jgi:5-methylcytosine-specific restriction endonuclease McrA